MGRLTSLRQLSSWARGFSCSNGNSSSRALAPSPPRQPVHEPPQLLLRGIFGGAEGGDPVAQRLDAGLLVGELLRVLLVERAVPVQLAHVLADAGLLLVEALDLVLQLGALRLE